jgi:hypothetical protein
MIIVGDKMRDKLTKRYMKFSYPATSDYVINAIKTVIGNGYLNGRIDYV